MDNTAKKVAVIMGSDSDLPVLEPVPVLVLLQLEPVLPVSVPVRMPEEPVLPELLHHYDPEICMLLIFLLQLHISFH